MTTARPAGPSRCIRFALAASLPLVLAAVPGCLDMSEARSFRDQAAGLRDDLARQEAAWRDRLAQAPPDDPDRPQLEARAALAGAKSAAAGAALARLDSVLSEANNPSDPLSRAVGWLVPFVPEPVRTPAALGAALAVTILRARRLKVGMASIARGLQYAMREDEEFAVRFRRNAQTFRTAQTPLARRVIDEATKDRAMLRLPI